MALAPALAAVLIALVALLLLYGVKYFARVISHLIPRNLPVIGSAISDAVEAAAGSAINTLQGWLDAAMRPMVAILTAPIHVFRSLFDAIDANLHALTAKVSYIRTAIIPYWYHRSLAYAAGLVAALRAFAVAEIAAARRELGLAIDRARFYARALFVAALAYVDAQITTLSHVLGYAIDSARLYARRLVAAAVAVAAAELAHAVTMLHASIATVDRYAHAAYADTIGRIAALSVFLQRYADAAAAAAVADATAVLDASITAGMTDVWHGVTAEIADLEGVIAGDFPDILAGLRNIDLSIPRDVATAVTGAAAISIPMLRYLKQCGLNNCRNLGGLGKDLQALFGLVDDVALLGLVVGLVTDPHGTAHEIESVTSGIVESVMHEASNLFGVG